MKIRTTLLTGLSSLFLASAFAADGNLNSYQQNQLAKEQQHFVAKQRYNDVYNIANRAHFYIQAGTGYDLTGLNNSNYKNNGGTFLFGGAAGYQFNRYLSVEGGYNYFLEIKPKVVTSPTINQWHIYGALKVIAPVLSHLHVYGKAGAQYVEYSGKTGTVKTTKNDTSAYLGAGVDIIFAHRLYAEVQYTLIPSISSGGTQLMPTQNMVMASVGVDL